MNLEDIERLVNIANGMGTLLLEHLPKAIEQIRCVTANNGFEIRADDEIIDHLKDYLNYKKTKEEKRRCKAILKKYNLPKSVGIMCKSENDICFAPNKAIVNQNLNNLNLRSNDGTVRLYIGGGTFAFNMEIVEGGIVHHKVMYGTIINYKSKIYLLRHPLGGSPYYLARLNLFINGIIVELDDGLKIGLYY